MFRIEILDLLAGGVHDFVVVDASLELFRKFVAKFVGTGRGLGEGLGVFSGF